MGMVQPRTGLELIRQWETESRKRAPRVKLPPFLGLDLDSVEKFKDRLPAHIIGIDEVGRGALAGPVTVCAFVAPTAWAVDGLRDSKKLSRTKRETFARAFRDGSLPYCIMDATAQRIDDYGMGHCLQDLFAEAAIYVTHNNWEQVRDALVVLDGADQVSMIKHALVPKGDDIVQQISAASVIAKVFRDCYMTVSAHRQYPQYGFDQHMGYGTAHHRAMIVKHGPCPLHRKSFLKNLDKWKE